MRVLTLKEIDQLEAGETIPSFKAQIKTVSPPKSGTNEYGPWTIQRILLMDGAALMTAKLFNIPEYQSAWQGCWIYVESGQTDKGKLAGIEVIKDEYRGKISKQIKISERATITQAQPDSAPTPEPTRLSDGGQARQAPEPQQAPPPIQAPLPISPTPMAPPPTQAPRAPAPEPQPAQARPAPVKPQATTEDIRRAIGEAKIKLGQAANGLILCYDAAIYTGIEVNKRHPEVTIPLFTPDVIEKLAISLWITLERSGLVMSLPVGPLEAWTKKEKEGTK